MLFIRPLGYLPVEGAGVNIFYFFRGSVVLDEKGDLFVNGMGHTAAECVS